MALSMLFTDRRINESSFTEAENFGMVYSSFDSEDFGFRNVAQVISRNDSYSSKKISSFVSFISKRTKYLDSLKKLPDDWISGCSSKRPDDDSINISKEILSSFIPKVFKSSKFNLSSSELAVPSNNSDFILPKILIGPVPSGGIILEFHLDADNAMFVSIPNKKQNIEIDIKKDGYYYELKTNKNNIAGNIVENYEYITKS